MILPRNLGKNQQEFSSFNRLSNIKLEIHSKYKLTNKFSNEENASKVIESLKMHKRAKKALGSFAYVVDQVTKPNPPQHIYQDAIKDAVKANRTYVNETLQFDMSMNWMLIQREKREDGLDKPCKYYIHPVFFHEKVISFLLNDEDLKEMFSFMKNWIPQMSKISLLLLMSLPVLSFNTTPSSGDKYYFSCVNNLTRVRESLGGVISGFSIEHERRKMVKRVASDLNRTITCNLGGSPGTSLIFHRYPDSALDSGYLSVRSIKREDVRNPILLMIYFCEKFCKERGIKPKYKESFELLAQFGYSDSPPLLLSPIISEEIDKKKEVCAPKIAKKSKISYNKRVSTQDLYKKDKLGFKRNRGLVSIAGSMNSILQKFNTPSSSSLNDLNNDFLLIIKEKCPTIMSVLQNE